MKTILDYIESERRKEAVTAGSELPVTLSSSSRDYWDVDPHAGCQEKCLPVLRDQAKNYEAALKCEQYGVD